MERLTEWRGEHAAVVDHHKNYIDRLAAYEDAEEQGLLVRLPCKVGTRVWFTPPESWSWLPRICEYEVTNIMISQNKKCEWTKKFRAMRIVNEKTVDDQINYAFDEIGKTVFLTREEAEAALKGE